jgi:hypothetical protein
VCVADQRKNVLWSAVLAPSPDIVRFETEKLFVIWNRVSECSGIEDPGGARIPEATIRRQANPNAPLPEEGARGVVRTK